MNLKNDDSFAQIFCVPIITPFFATPLAYLTTGLVFYPRWILVIYVLGIESKSTKLQTTDESEKKNRVDT